MPGSGEVLGLLVACTALVVLCLSQSRRGTRSRRTGRERSTKQGGGRGRDGAGVGSNFATLNAANQQHFAHRDRRALVDAELHALVDSGALQFHLTHPVPRPVDLHGYVQPASIDLPVTGSAFLVKEKVLPFHHRVLDLLPGLTLERKELSGDGVVLLKGQTYLVYCGTVHLPPNMKGLLSPKSSIGRVDLLVRGVVDGIGLYDTIPGGSSRSLWLEITPRSFNVRIREGLALTQLMVFRACVDADDAPSHATAVANGGDAADADADAGETAVATVVAAAATATTPALRGGGGGPSCIGSGQRAVAAAAAATASQPLIFDEHGAPLPHSWENGALVLSLNVPDESAAAGGGHDVIVGYEAISTNEVVDLSRVRCHDWQKYFRRIELRSSVGTDSDANAAGDGEGGGGGGGEGTNHNNNNNNSNSNNSNNSNNSSNNNRNSSKSSTNRRLTLEKDRFYILATKEHISVPNHLSAEMVPFSHHVGELRAHYAGFFDPGFGFGKAGEKRGTVGVLEVRPHETINIFHGQPICLMEFFRNSRLPDKPYGFSGNNYSNQRGPQLAKFFRMSNS